METKPAAPSPNAGGRLQWPSGLSQTSSPPPAADRNADARRPVCGVQNPVSCMPSGSKIRVRSTSANGCPEARASSTPSTDAPVLYNHRSPGWASSGSEPRPAIQVSGSGCSAGSGGPIVDRCSSCERNTTGHGSAAVNIPGARPKPNVNVSRSPTVTERLAGTVSSSGPSIRRSTRGAASSGSSLPTGSSRSSRPSRIRARVAAPVTGLVMDAMRNSESRCTGGPPIDSEPSASAWT